MGIDSHTLRPIYSKELGEDTGAGSRKGKNRY